jgi:hypothetical protein
VEVEGKDAKDGAVATVKVGVGGRAVGVSVAVARAGAAVGVAATSAAETLGHKLQANIGRTKMMKTD